MALRFLQEAFDLPRHPAYCFSIEKTVQQRIRFFFKRAIRKVVDER